MASHRQNVQFHSEIRLTIETHVLSEGLRQQDIMALLNEVTHSPSIAVNVSTCKALIGHIKENKQVPFLQDKERKHLFRT